MIFLAEQRNPNLKSKDLFALAEAKIQGEKKGDSLRLAESASPREKS